MTGLIKVTGGKREALQHVARAPVVVLVFSMDGCGPCKALKQRLKTLEGTFDDVMYVECNVDDSDDNYAFAEPEDVTGYPTVDIYEYGTRVGKDVDFQNIEDVIRDAAAPYQSPMKTPQKSGGSASGRTCHAFVGYKGGSGKSTLLFQTASQYAKENPQDNVLVIDSSFSGDLSHLFLRKHGKLSADKSTRFILEALYKDKISSRHLFEFLLKHQTEATPKDAGQRRLFYESFYSPMESLTLTKGKTEERVMPDIAKMFSVRVCDYNAHIPMENLHLIPSGHDDRQPAAGMGENAVPKLAKLLRMCLDDLQGKNWKIFFDTDGDFQLTNSLKVILRACDTMVTITEVDTLGFQRIVLLLEDIKEYQDELLQKPTREDIQEFPDIRERTRMAGLSAILFNKVEVGPQKGNRFDEIGCNVLPHMVAIRELVKDNANRFTYAALTMRTKLGASGLFKDLQDLPPGISDEERAAFFKKRMFAVIQVFKVPLALSIDAGIPICCIELNKKYTSDISYGGIQFSPYVYTVTNANFLISLIDNIDEIIERL